MKVMVAYQANNKPNPPVALPDKLTSIATQQSDHTNSYGVTRWVMKLKGTGRFSTSNALRLAFRMMQHVILTLDGEVIRVQIDFKED